ncbi:MAG: hypothetical protein K6T75_11340, partial [Acetobacteraceae bacterium]|nr:hypothetical protein [Acetobacteraceae bacterium]
RLRPGRPVRAPRRRGSWGLGGVAAALAILVLALGAGRLRDSMTLLLARTEAVSESRLEQALDARALVVRGEWVVRSPADGRLRLVAVPGQRVRAGAVLAEVENPGRTAELQAQLGAVEAELGRLKQQLSPRLEALSARVAELDASLRERALAWSSAAVEGRVSLLPRLRSELERLARERAEAAAQEAEGRGRLEQLEGRRKGLLSALAGVQQAVVAPGAGAFSLRLDGLEEELLPSRRAEISPAQLFSFRTRPGGASDGLKVGAGDPLFKVVDPLEVYLGMSLPSARAEELAQAQRLWVEYGAGSEVEAAPAGLGSPEAGGRRVLWVALVGAPELFLEARRAQVKLAWARWEGVSVPAGALVRREGSTGVFVVEKTSARFKPVVVRFSAADRVGVEGLAPGTRVVRNPWLVRDGSRVR